MYRIFFVVTEPACENRSVRRLDTTNVRERPTAAPRA